MVLHRPALVLRPGARGVQEARHRVAATFRDLDRDDLAECAALGVSELVTNAVLHAEEPITVRVRGTADHPRVEVRDASTDPPRFPDTVDDLGEDYLLTVGRGLSIVARAAVAWGAEIEPDGKVVWFCPAPQLSESAVAPGILSGETAAERAPALTDPVTVTVRGVPLRDYQEFANHFRELRREVRLLALAHAEDYPLASDLSEAFGQLDEQLPEGIGERPLARALADGAEHADLRVRIPRSATEPLSSFLDLLDLADEFARQHRLLALARTPEQVRFQRWFLGEYVAQAHGRPPTPWPA